MKKPALRGGPRDLALQRGQGFPALTPDILFLAIEVSTRTYSLKEILTKIVFFLSRKTGNQSKEKHLYSKYRGDMFIGPRLGTSL